MVGTIAVQLNIMPKSLDTSLKAIKKEIQKVLKEARNLKFEEKEIAFGLKSLQVLIAWPDGTDTDIIENKVSQIKGVSSCKIEDIRRAFG